MHFSRQALFLCVCGPKTRLLKCYWCVVGIVITTTTYGVQILTDSSEPLHIQENETQSSPRQQFPSETKFNSLAGQLNLVLCKLGFATSNPGFIYVLGDFPSISLRFSLQLGLAHCGFCPAANDVWKSEKKVSLINWKPEPVVYLIWKIDQIIVVFIACWNGRLFWKKIVFKGGLPRNCSVRKW